MRRKSGVTVRDLMPEVDTYLKEVHDITARMESIPRDYKRCVKLAHELLEKIDKVPDYSDSKNAIMRSLSLAGYEFSALEREGLKPSSEKRTAKTVRRKYLIRDVLRFMILYSDACDRRE